MSVVMLSTGYYADPDTNKPIALGYIYVGKPDLDPTIEANQKQISVLQEDTTTVDVDQPLRTGAGGVPTYNGSPVTILVSGKYSLKVLSKTLEQKYYIPTSDDSGASDFATVAALRASTGPFEDNQVGTIVEYADGYGLGGGDVYWDSASEETDNSGTIFKVASIATGRWKRIMNGGSVPASLFGVIPGTITLSEYVNLILYTVSLGVDAEFDVGTYDFDNATINNEGAAFTSHRVVGENKKTIFTNIASTDYQGDVKSRGIKYTNSLQPIFMTGDITSLDFLYNEFVGCTRCIYHNDAAGNVADGYIAHNIFRDITASELTGAVLLHRSDTLRNVTVENNKLSAMRTNIADNSSFLGIVLGQDITPTGTPENYTNNHAINNEIDDCGKASAVYNAAGPQFGVQVVGEDCTQTGNVVTNGKWLSPCYMKGNGITQRDNKCHDNQMGGITMKINSGTLVSKNNVQDGNVITGQCDVRPAVRMFGSGVSVNSQVDITIAGASPVDPQGGFAFNCTSSNTVDGRLLITGRFKAPSGMKITTGGDVEIDANLESEDYGYDIQPAAGKTLNNVKISGDVDSQSHAVFVSPCDNLDLSGLQIKSNNYTGFGISNNVIFANTVKSIDLSDTQIHLTDTLADGNSLSTVVSLYGQTGQVKTDNFGFLSDRDIPTSVFRLNSSTGVGDYTFTGGIVDVSGVTATALIDTLSNLDSVAIHSMTIIGSFTRTLTATGKTMGKVVIGNNIMDYVGTDNLAGHTNGTATTSRINDNKTA